MPTPGREATISIDVRPATSRSAADHAALAFLLEHLRPHGWAATWVVSDPSGSWITRHLAEDGLCHEIAVRAEDRWNDQRAWAGEFPSQLRSGRGTGFALTTLAVNGTFVPESHWLARWGVQTLRVSPNSRASCGAPVEKGRHGIWRVTPELVIDEHRSWRSSRRERQSLRHLEDGRTGLHASIALQACCQTPVQRRVVRLFDALATAAAGGVAVRTIEEFRLSRDRRRNSPQARSLLRAA